VFWIGAALLTSGFGAPAVDVATVQAAECELVGSPKLVGRLAADEGRVGARVDARAGQAIDVFVQISGRLNGRRVVFADDGGAGHVSWSGSGCAPVEVRWRRVEPTMEHVDTPAPNEGLSLYANAVMFGPKHGAWIGYDRLEVRESPLPAGDDRWTLQVRDARPSDEALAGTRTSEMAGLGVMRLSVGVRGADGVERHAPGVAGQAGAGRATRRGALTDAVFRYTYRSGDDLFGWLTTFFNVPYVFGSAGVGARSQAERYIGADCADVIVAALRRAGHRDVGYTSVGGLTRKLPRVAEPVFVPAQAGAPPTPYEPAPGDILAIDYVGATSLPRPWDHVVVFVADRGPEGIADGVLGPEDLVADIGDARGLRFSPLRDQGAVRALPLRPRGRGKR